MNQTVIGWMMAPRAWRVLAVSSSALKRARKSTVCPVSLTYVGGRAQMLREGLWVIAPWMDSPPCTMSTKTALKWCTSKIVMEVVGSVRDGIPMPPSLGFLLFKASNFLTYSAGASLSLAPCPETEHHGRSSLPVGRRGEEVSVGDLQLELPRWLIAGSYYGAVNLSVLSLPSLNVLACSPLRWAPHTASAWSPGLCHGEAVYPAPCFPPMWPSSHIQSSSSALKPLSDVWAFVMQLQKLISTFCFQPGHNSFYWKI